MKKVKRRAMSVLLIILCLMVGVGVFSYRFFHDGSQWVNFTANKHIYANGVLIGGAIYDRDGNPLVHTEDGVRKYSDNKNVRCATMHIVGDKKSNIATSLQKVYADELMGYNIINGTYSVSGTGNSIYTTLDADICAAAYKQLKGKKGAMCIYNYRTGEVICLVSTPTYDPENPPVISADDDSYEGVYLNRVLSSRFTPGSTYKLVTAAAAIDTIDDIFDQTFVCHRYEIVNGQKIVCSGTHHEEDFPQALANSCNIAFGNISRQLGWETTVRYARQLGITEAHTLNGIKVVKGSIATSGGENELSWTGIGQHNDLVSPFAMMRCAGIIANHGMCVEPYLIEKITDSSGFRRTLPISPDSTRCLSRNTADQLAEMMRNNVLTKYGEENFPQGMEICAKSGTAELDGGQTSHAWFIGFCRNENYPYAFVSFVQNGGNGARVAGGAVSKVLAEIQSKTDEA